ncbi:GNAT family N-acetyltransferase [soil metagenome]
MSNTTTYRWGRLGPYCIEQWAALSNTLARVDGTDEFVEAEDLAEEFTSATFDPELDSWAIWFGEELVGHGYIFVPTSPSFEGVARMFLLGGIHPDHRRRGLGQQLIERQEDRAATLAAQRHPQHPTAWLAEGGIEGADVRGLLRARGYEVVRYFSRMVRPLPAAALLSETPPEIADGIRLVTPGDQDSEPLRLVHNVAFRDHWGAGEKSQQAWEHERSARSARPAFDSMAVDAQGEPLSYVLCAQWVPRELYVDVVGTAPQARGAGLARACAVANHCCGSGQRRLQPGGSLGRLGQSYWGHAAVRGGRVRD